MPPAVAVVVAVGAGAAAAAGAIAVTTALTIASVALAGSALLNKPKIPDTSSATSPAERKQVIRAAASPMVGVVGNSQVSGVLTFAEENKSNDELNLAIALAGHTRAAGEPVVQQVNRVLMDDEEIPLGESHSGKVFVRVYDGSQSSINDLGSELTRLPSWRSDMIGKGICFAHIRVQYDQELFPSGLPNFVFELDALGEVSLSSDAILDYLRHNFGATDEEIDFESFDVARPICNETVSNGNGSSESRYTCNGAFNFNESHKQVIDKMRLTCAGQLTYINGKFGLKVGAYQGPADFVLTEDDIIGDVSVKPGPDRRSMINTCKGKHVWPDAKFQEVDFPQIRSEALIAEDGEALEKDLNLEFCHSPYQCQRLAANDISRARLPVITVPCNMRAFECYLGRNIQLHMPSIGYDHKECIVEGWELDPEKGVTLTLREDSPEVWTDIVGKVPVLPPDIQLPNPKVSTPVSSITATELEVDGIWQARLEWQHPNPNGIYEYWLLIEKNEAGSWTEKHNVEVRQRLWQFTVPEPGDYRATIKAVNRFDVCSAPLVYNFSVNIPEVSIIALHSQVDGSVYPAQAFIAGQEQGANSFPAESVVYETETRSATSDWVAIGKGTAPNARLNGLEAGTHAVRMRAVPPYGSKSDWNQTEFEVFAADQPVNLILTADSSYDRWGCLTWDGVGQSWEVAVSKNEKEVWSTTTTERNSWLDWLPAGSYTVAVRSRAGSLHSDWSYINAAILDLLPPTELTYTPDTSSTAGGLVKWVNKDPRTEMFEMELSGNQDEILYTAMTGSPQTNIPMLAPGNYTAKARGRWRDQLSSWETLVITTTDEVAAPTDFIFKATNESAWLGELTWNTRELTSELQIINQDTAEPVSTATLLSGYYHVPLLPVGNYKANVRTVGSYTKSEWVSAAITVAKPVSPSNLSYRETADNPASAGQLSWYESADNGVSSYDVAIIDSNNNSVLATRVQSTWLDIGNIANGNFIARVRSVSLLASETSEWIETTFTVSALAAPVNFAVEEKLVESGTGFTSQVSLKWQANDARTTAYDVEYRQASSTAWSGLYSGPSSNATRNSLMAGDYRFRVRAKSGAMESGFAEVSLAVRGMETAPDDVTGLQLSGITGQMAQLSWNKITSVDVINGGSIHVRHTPFTGSAASWATAVPITERLPGNTTLVTVPLLTGTYLVKAVNPAEYWSVNPAAVVSNMGSLVGYNRVVDRTEPAGWPGEKNRGVIDSGGSLTLSDHTLLLHQEVNSGNKHKEDITVSFNSPFAGRCWVRMDLTDAEGNLVFTLNGQPWNIKPSNADMLRRWYEYEADVVYGQNQIVINTDKDGVEFHTLQLSAIGLSDEPPYYIMHQPLDLGAIFTTRLHLEWNGTVYERDTIDQRTDNIDNWDMFDGAVAGGTSLQFQVSTTDDDPTNPNARWSDWTQFFVGEFRARAFRLRVVLMNSTPSSAGTLAGLKLVADVPDRTETGNTISVPATGKTIRYQKTFLAPAVIAVNAHNMATGDYYRITNNTAAGFTIRFYNSAGTGVARTVDFTAVSYGEG